MQDFYEKTVVGIEPGENGEKDVHFFGYGYCAEDGTDTPYRFVEYTWFIVPLKEVLKTGFASYEGDNSDQYKQYITDCTEESMYDIYMHYDNGSQPVVIKEEDISENTPFGCYIVIPKV